MPAASVIIRSFNEAEYIEDTLQAVSRQAYDDFELILIDSGSTDGTLDIAEEYVDEIRLVDPRNFTFGYSLNIGCNAATEAHLVFLSAHAIPTDDEWLGTLVDNLRDEEVAMTYSKQIGKGPTKLSEDRLFDRLFPNERKRQQSPEFFANNASSAIKRSLWEEHNFDESLTGHEDIEWAKHFIEQGYTVVYEPEACIYHIHDETWEQVYRRFEREAIADREIGIRTASEWWGEYAAIPRDIVTDTVAAMRRSELGLQTLKNIVQFRYYQHTGSASGLQKERDLETDRYEYFYPEANEQIRIEQPGQITVAQTPLPEVRPNDVLIKVKYAGITNRELKPYRENSESFPIVPGREYAGEVIDIGANVEKVSIGDDVTGGSVFHCGLCQACDDERYAACDNRTELGTGEEAGSFSKFITVPSTHVYKLPPGLSIECAILAGPLALIVDGVVRVESLFATSNGRICIVGDGLLGELARVYLNQQGHSPSTITDVTSSSQLESCQLIIIATASEKRLQEVLHRSRPGTKIVLLETKLNEIKIDPGDIVEKVLITAQRGGEAHFNDALQLLADGNYKQFLDSQYSIDQLVIEPLSAPSQSGISLLNLHGESYDPR
jgi:threonine dehydrogenase-like Zn-dependent dehydrogenase